MTTTLDRPKMPAVPPQSNGSHEVIAMRRTAGPYTVADWLKFEESKDRKHELRNGEYIEMAGAAYEHNVIAGHIFGIFFVALEESDCEVLGSDQKIYIDNKNGLYPDVAIVCGEPMIAPAEALQNPVLIVEVLSPSTAADDRGEKFEKYRTRPTLKHYILTEQHRPSVEHFEKGDNGIWSLVAEHHSLDETLTITLSGATITIPLTAIYRRISFPSSE